MAINIDRFTQRRRRAALAMLGPIAMMLLSWPASGRTLSSAFSVRVVDESGSVVADSTVAITETGDNRVNLLLETDASGRVTSSVPDGTYAVTVFPPPTGGPATEFVRSTVQGIPVAADRQLDVVLRRGIPIQTCVRSEDGRPLAGARVDTLTTAFDPNATAYSDASGWVRIVAAPDEWLMVTPPPDGGLEIGAWIRVADLARDADGLAAPIVLSRLAPAVTGPDGVTIIHRATSSAGRIRIGVISEGYTDGNEPFEDRNGNGRCDDEPFLDLDGDGRADPNEPFSDANFNGRRDAEPFTDTNGDGVCNRDERAAFLRAVTDGVRMVLAYPVYREFADRIEFVAAFVPSAQAGSDFPSLSTPISRDTLFDSRFVSSNYVFNLDRSKAELEGLTRLGELDVFAVMTNSLFNLGRESANGALFLFGHPQADVSSTLAHELGHAIGKLGDEYFEYDGAPPYNGNEPSFPNLTKSPDLATLKWNRFVRPGVGVPTADGTPGTGAFEGAYYRRHGVYRPAHSCLMRRYGPFCRVCTDVMFSKIFALVGDPRPEGPIVVSLRPGSTVSGWTAVGAVTADGASIATTEVLVDGIPDGTPLGELAFGVLIDTSRYSNGAHAIAIAVTDTNGMRRVSPSVTVVVSNETRIVPTIGTPEFRGGTLVFPQAAGIAVPGSVVIVNGKDRYPLEVTGSGLVRTVKASIGSASRLRLAKAIPKRRDVLVRIVNASGGQSDEVTFRR